MSVHDHSKLPRPGGKVVKFVSDPADVKSIAVPAILTHEQLRAAQAGLQRRFLRRSRLLCF